MNILLLLPQELRKVIYDMVIEIERKEGVLSSSRWYYSPTAPQQAGTLPSDTHLHTHRPQPPTPLPGRAHLRSVAIGRAAAHQPPHARTTRSRASLATARVRRCTFFQALSTGDVPVPSGGLAVA